MSTTAQPCPVTIEEHVLMGSTGTGVRVPGDSRGLIAGSISTSVPRPLVQKVLHAGTKSARMSVIALLGSKDATVKVKRPKPS